MLRRALLLVPSVLRSCRLSAALNATTTSADSSRARTQEVSPGKDLNFPLGPSGSTCSVLMRFGFRVCQHADRPLPASLPVRVPMVAGLPAASFSSTLAGVALRFSYGCSHQLRCHRFMSLVKAHAGHTDTGILPVTSKPISSVDFPVRVTRRSETTPPTSPHEQPTLRHHLNIDTNAKASRIQARTHDERRSALINVVENHRGVDCRGLWPAVDGAQAAFVSAGHVQCGFSRQRYAPQLPGLSRRAFSSFGAL
jgi:hypothetical protein